MGTCTCNSKMGYSGVRSNSIVCKASVSSDLQIPTNRILMKEYMSKDLKSLFFK